MIGFETIGNATLIVHDDRPVLVTDPWYIGPAYFGSWVLSHEIPAEQVRSIESAENVWLSHGHPDHLSSDSLERLRGKKILLADHVGARLEKDLTEGGFDVTVLPDRKWVDLSKSVRVMAIADFNQDSILLVDIAGRLVVNTNDAAPAHGWGRSLPGIVKGYDKSFLLALTGHGDADMINFWDENGNRCPPLDITRPIGWQIGQMLLQTGAKSFIPFSSMHRYQRTDSIWADDFVMQIDGYKRGFDSDRGEILPPFIRYDCVSDEYTAIDPPENVVNLVEPEALDDSWSDELEDADKKALTDYVRQTEYLATKWDFIRFRVGGHDHTVPLAARNFERGISFEVPRNSLLTAVRYSVFDDLLIGNFMKTTIHGGHTNSLYPDFSPYVTKYSDNGGARTRDQLAEYFRAYRARAPIDHLYHALDVSSKSLFRRFAAPDSAIYLGAKSVYLRLTTGSKG